MSIVFLIRSLNVGGAERQLVTLAKEFVAKGFQVLVITFYPGGPLFKELVDARVPVTALEKRGRWDVIGFVFRLVRVLRQQRPQVIVAWLVEPGLIASFVKPMFPRVRIVWGVLASNMNLADYGWFPRFTFWLSRRVSRWADLVIANSWVGAEYHCGQGYPRATMVVVPNGIDLERFKPDTEMRRRLRSEWGIGEDETAIGIVARLDPMKDHAGFLQAAAILCQERSDVRFICVGDGPAPFVARLRARADELGIGQRVLWTGLMSDMPAVYNALDLLCSSSAYGEGHSNSLGEAMACGVPCVATDVGDASRIIEACGVVVAPRNPPLLAEGMRALLKRSGPGLQQACRTRMREHFSVSRMVQETERHLRECIDGSA